MGQKQGQKQKKRQQVPAKPKENGPRKRRSSDPDASHSSEEETVPSTAVPRLFPKYSIWMLALAILGLRFLIAPNPANWWLIHPSEIEPLEVAHCSIYGYGYVKSPDELTNQPMWPLYHRLFFLTFKLKEQLKLTMTPFEAARLLQALIASVLPVGVYMFVMQLTEGNKSAGIISAALSAGSTHLMVMALHTFPHGLTSPILFLALGLSVQVLKASASPPPPEADEMQLTMDTSILGLFRDIYGTFQLPRIFVYASAVGISTYIQMDRSILLLLFVCGCHIFFTCKLSFSKWFIPLFIWLLGFCAGIGIGGYDDFLVYGKWFYTMPNRPFLPASGDLWMVLLPDILTSSMVLYAPVLLSAVLLLPPWLTGSLILDRESSNTGATAALSFISASLLVIVNYETPLQLHEAVVLLSIASGCCTALLYAVLTSSLDPSGEAGLAHVFKALAYAELVLYTMGTKTSFPLQGNQLAVWSPIDNSSDVNHCLAFMSFQEMTSGVVLDYPIQSSARYSVLHKDVPIIFRDGDSYSRVSRSASNCGEIEEGVDSGEGLPYLMKDPAYDFVVTRQNPKLFQKSFHMAYEYEGLRVFQRKRFAAQAA